MNRRQAIAALVSLPEVARISAAPVGLTDVLVVETDTHITLDAAKRITEVMQQVWPGRRVLIFDKGVTLKIVPGA